MIEILRISRESISSPYEVAVNRGPHKKGGRRRSKQGSWGARGGGAILLRRDNSSLFDTAL